MALTINQNVLSIKTYGTLTATSNRLEKSIARLSSGVRINGAADDAAGLAISEKMRRQIRGLSRAILNSQDGISMLQTAEGALGESHGILQRMRELAVQSSSDTLPSGDRQEIQKELNQLRDELNRIATNTEFNTKRLLDGSQSAWFSASTNAVKGIVTGDVGEGGDFDVSITLVKAGVSEMQRTQIFTKVGSNDLADGRTQLQSIAQFYDANGVFALESPQALVANGKGNSAAVVIDGQMTLDRLAATFQDAMGAASGLAIANTRSAVINTAQTSIAGMGGYIEITSGSIGDAGRVAFTGEQRLIEALGLAVTREAANNQVEVTSRDAQGNIRAVRTDTDRVAGLMQGMDVRFASQSAQVAGTRGLEQGLDITAAQAFKVKIGDYEANVSINVGKWTMEGLARSVNKQIETISGLTTAVVNGELRLSYEKPTHLDSGKANTIEIVSASANAKVLGFVDGTYSGFVDSSKDTSKGVWGFSQFVVSGTSNLGSGVKITFTLNDGVKNTTVTVMTTITDKTAADMKSFSILQKDVNAALKTASVAIRIDQVGGAMVFTALRVGSENRNDQVLKSEVKLTMSAQGTAAATDLKTYMFSSLGISEATSRGTGDKNFKVRVVSTSPQFQIGADQGQTMKTALADMTADALGVGNLDMTSVDGAQRALAKINKAVDLVSGERSKLGSYMNRLEYAITNLRNTHSNLTASESRIRDADIAMEMIEFTRNQIVSQSGTAMLAQANLVPQGVLQLLR